MLAVGACARYSWRLANILGPQSLLCIYICIFTIHGKYSHKIVNICLHYLLNTVVHHSCFVFELFFRLKIALTSENEGNVLTTAQTELKLLHAYNIQLPKLHSHLQPPGEEDCIALDILKKCHPAALDDFTPRAVIGDGNCMYRAVSLALYGSEKFHAHLRLVTTLEIMQNRPYYDAKHRKTIDLINDDRVLSPEYQDLIKTACSDGGYAELLHMYAVSAAINQPLRSYYPPTGTNEELTKPFTRRIQGRNVLGNTPVATLMWSQLNPIVNTHEFSPNHFVVLHSRITIENVDLTEDEGSSSDISDKKQYSDILDKELRIFLKDCTTSDYQGYKDPSTSLELCSSMEDQYYYDGSDEDEDDDSTTSSESNFEDDNECSNEQPSEQQGAHGNLIYSRFLNVEAILELLQNTDENKTLNSVPLGPKENVYFILNNRGNNMRRAKGMKSEYLDDCGAWVTGKTGSPKCIYIKGSHGRYEIVYLKDDMYCKQKRIQKQLTYMPLDPQPDSDHLLVVCHNYAALKLNESYKRKITWFSKIPNDLPPFLKEAAVYEYIGTFPGTTFHGNTKHAAYHYTRCPAEVMQNISQKSIYMTPKNTYAAMLREDEDEYMRPQNIKQIKNKKYRDKRKRMTDMGHTMYAKNFADNVQRVENMVHSHPFVQTVIHMKDTIPSVVCYTEDQLLDLHRACLYHGQVLGFDKTFNLGDVHVTVSAYKNVTVRSLTTGEHPIMLGPILLHGSSTYTSYKAFFSHLANRIPTFGNNELVVGSDDEKAMKKAIRDAFPDAYQVLCTRHLKKSVDRQLCNTIGIDKKMRHRILKRVFSPTGLAGAENKIVFDERLETVQSLVRKKVPGFVKYFETHLIPQLTKYVVKPYQDGVIQSNWTNNNCEALNSVIKQATERRQWNLVELIEKIYNILKTQHEDMQRALIGRGNFYLETAYHHHQMSPAVWTSKEPKLRRKHFLCFLKDYKSGQSKKYVTSTDGSRNVPSPSGSRKPGQRRRKQAEKTISSSNKKIKFC